MCIIGFTRCKSETKEEKLIEITHGEVKNIEQDSIIENTGDVLYDETSLNKTDDNGLKQGVWEIQYNNKLWKRENFKNGKLNGKCFEFSANGEIHETQYINGIRDGYYLHYEPKSKSSKFLTRWEQGDKVWSTFPVQIEKDLIPVKGFIYRGKDTIQITIPFNSGKTLSIGSIVKGGKPIGKHVIYYETQEIKAIVNYETDSVKTFDIQGDLIENRPFKGMELIHRD